MGKRTGPQPTRPSVTLDSMLERLVNIVSNKIELTEHRLSLGCEVAQTGSASGGVSADPASASAPISAPRDPLHLVVGTSNKSNPSGSTLGDPEDDLPES